MSRRLSLADEARLFALLDIALADAGISCWETKNFYDFWRPVTAIRAGDSDGNPLTAGDPNWTPLWATPAFSSYTSGHATFSAAAATVLDSVFGANFAFTDTGDPTAAPRPAALHRLRPGRRRGRRQPHVRRDPFPVRQRDRPGRRSGDRPLRPTTYGSLKLLPRRAEFLRPAACSARTQLQVGWARPPPRGCDRR